MHYFWIEKHYKHSRLATFLAGAGSVLTFGFLVGLVFSLVLIPGEEHEIKVMLLVIAGICLVAVCAGIYLFFLADKIGRKAEEEFIKKEKAEQQRQLKELLSRTAGSSTGIEE